MTVQRYETNQSGRDFVVGDIHGRLDLLQILLEQTQFTKATDRLFAVGDLIDRGAQSPECIQMLNEPWFFSARGNHEQMMLNALQDSWWKHRGASLTDDFDVNTGLWLSNGGGWALGHSYAELCDLAAIIEQTPVAIVVGEGATRFNVLHAEFFGSDEDLLAGDFGDAVKERALWGRSNISGNCALATVEGSAIFCGHTIVGSVGRVGRHIYLDTGSYLDDGGLSMLEPATGAIWSTLPIRPSLEWERDQ